MPDGDGWEGTDPEFFSVREEDVSVLNGRSRECLKEFARPNMWFKRRYLRWLDEFRRGVNNAVAGWHVPC
jgi:hypothetical protein